jgi:predicted negative regulator of RcsB-dependent stress response
MSLTFQERIDDLVKRTDGSGGSTQELLKDTEELIRELQQAGERFLELRTRHLNANQIYLTGRHSEALQHYYELLNTCLTENTRTLLPRLYLSIARLHSTQQDDKLALDYIHRSRTESEAQNDKETIAECNLLLGITLAKSQQYKEALQAYNEAAKYSYQTNNTRRMGAIFFLIAQLHFHADQFEAAKEACEHAIRYFSENNNNRGKILSTSRMASILSALNDHDAALDLLRDFEPLALQLELPYISCGFYCIKAEVLLAMKLFAACKEALDIATGHAEASNNPRNILDTEKIRFVLELELGNLSEARATLDKALEIARSCNDKHWEMKLYKCESEFHAKTGNYERSLEFYKLYHERERKITEESTEVRLMMIHVNHELIEKERETELYRLRTEKLQRELSSKSTHLASESETLARFRDELKEVLSEKAEAPTILRKVKQKLVEMPASAINWEEYDKHFHDAHPDFTKNLIARFPELTPMETKICSLLKVGLTSKEIAHILALSERSIENHRYRLRKKMGLGDANISQFLNTL